MKLANFYIIVLLILGLISCTDNKNPVTTSPPPLFSITVVDAQGNPAEGLLVGSINHFIPQGLDPDDFIFYRPCPATQITFSLPEASSYLFSIFDYNGELIWQVTGYANAGVQSIIWDGTDSGGVPVISGFYRYELTAGQFHDEKWMIMEMGFDPYQTFIGSLDARGNFSTDNMLLFPGLLDPQPIIFYNDSITIHLSRPEYPGDFFLYKTVLNREANSFSFVLDSLWPPEYIFEMRK